MSGEGQAIKLYGISRLARIAGCAVSNLRRDYGETLPLPRYDIEGRPGWTEAQVRAWCRYMGWGDAWEKERPTPETAD